jgi:formate hydrogenlyase subunit 3/multisubunit Na+/H+ antiporter MnhD subunit
VTSLPGPMILIALPLAAAAITHLVRRWVFLSTFIAATTASVLVLLCFYLPLDRSAFVLGQEVGFGRPVVILGRNLVLDASGQAWLTFVFALAVVFYLFAWRISQGRSFVSFSLAILALYALVTLLQTFSLAVLVFAISVTLGVFIVQGGLRASIRGGQRYLLISLLSVPLLLVAAWLVDQALLSPENAAMAQQALLPAVLGFGLLLAVFPFGTWMPALAADAPPIVTAFIFTSGQAMTLYLMLVFLRTAPWMMSDTALPTVIQLAGLTMAAIGGLVAAVQRDFGRLLGYAALSDLGYLLLALVMVGSQGQALALLHTISRALSITLMAASLSILRYRATTDRFEELQGVARRLPVATLGLILGGLALAGFPLTAGFPTHWAVGRAVWNWALPFSPLTTTAVTDLEPVAGGQLAGGLVLLALLIAPTGIIIGLLRGLSAMLGSRLRQDMAKQPIIASFLVLALAALVVCLGLYPQLFLEPVLRAAKALSSF